MSQVATQRPMTRERSVKSWINGHNVLRAALALALLFAGGVLALVGERLIGAGGSAAANETRVTTFQDWRVICPPVTPQTPTCALSLDVLRDTGGILMTVSLVDPAPNAPLTLTVPHGVALDSGMGFSVGNEPMRVRPYETCNNAGCIAQVTIDADTLKALSNNQSGQVVVAVPGNASPVTIPFSLKGFKDGYSELERAKSRRTSYFRFIGL